MSKRPRKDRWASSSSDEDDNQKKSKKVMADTENKFPPSTKDCSSNDCVQYHNPLLHGCRLVYASYEKIKHISEGTYGIVWKAKDISTNEIVALKQMKFHSSSGLSTTTTGFISGSSAADNCSIMDTTDIFRDGFPVTALREVNVLLALSSTNIVNVREVVVGDRDPLTQVYMVMDYFDCDLKDALLSRQQRPGALSDGPLTQAELKGILHQILSGVNHIHQHGYLHRDIKPSNILVKRGCNVTANSSSSNGPSSNSTTRIAVADFGLARRQPPLHVNMTLPVVTLWYRAPELLFGASHYTGAVDMWSVGCCMGELVLSGGKSTTSKSNQDIGQENEEDGNALMKGQGELDQINQIFSLVGGPSSTNWPTFAELPNAKILRWKGYTATANEDDDDDDNTGTITSTPTKLYDMFQSKNTVISSSSAQTFLDENGYELLQSLLTLDPQQRVSSLDAINHEYFTRGVTPKIPDFF